MRLSIYIDYSYDNNGNLIQKQNTTAGTTIDYSYDYENRLKSVTTPLISVSYSFDGDNRRVSKTAGGITTNYVYDSESVVQELNGDGVLQASYVYGPKIDEIISMEKDSVLYYYHTDAIGTVRSLTNSTGETVADYSYDAFGNTKNENTVIANSYRFTGREYEEETGLYYYRNRFYDTRTGRFLQADPSGYVDGLNLYNYCIGNPINYADPFGLKHYCADEVEKLLAEEYDELNRDPYNLDHLINTIKKYDYKYLNKDDTFSVEGRGRLSADEFGNYSAGWVTTKMYGPAVGFYGSWLGGISYAWFDYLDGSNSTLYPVDDWGSVSNIADGASDATTTL